MSAIKRFFEKKKLDTKFKQAGAGHKLTDEQEKKQPVTQTQQHRQQPTTSSARAGEAALAR